METGKSIREKKGRNNMKKKNSDKEKGGEKVKKVKSNKLLVNLWWELIRIKNQYSPLWNVKIIEKHKKNKVAQSKYK